MAVLYVVRNKEKYIGRGGIPPPIIGLKDQPSTSFLSQTIGIDNLGEDMEHSLIIIREVLILA